MLAQPLQSPQPQKPLQAGSGGSGTLTASYHDSVLQTIKN